MYSEVVIRSQKETVIKVCPDHDDTPESLYSREYEDERPVQVDKQGDTGMISGGSMSCSYWVCHPGLVREFVQCYPNKVPQQTMKTTDLGDGYPNAKTMDNQGPGWCIKESMPHEGRMPEDDFSPKAGGK